MNNRVRGNAPGSAARAVAENVALVRRRRGMKQSDLAAKLAEVGRPIPTASVAKIEAGTRRVDVDDLAALATALGATAGALMTPLLDGQED